MTTAPDPGFKLLSISIDRDERGKLIEYSPHTRFAGAATHRLHKYGLGPFCRIRVVAPSREGVYAVRVRDVVTYVGKCQDARVRWGPQGYGLISPRNCFDGGQRTNCKVNHLILEAARASQLLELWFRELRPPGALEAELIRRFRPPWNGSQPA